MGLVEKPENKVTNLWLEGQEVAEQREVLAVKPEDLSSVPGLATPKCCPLTCVCAHTEQLDVNRERKKLSLRMYCVRAAVMDH